MDDQSTSVTTLTDPFYQLIKIDGKTHAPPVCFFSWGDQFPGQRNYATTGSQQRHGFKCIVESVRQRFTLFSPQGVPLRATLTVSLKEYKTLAEQIAEINKQSPDHTRVHVVQQGETLSRIAAAEYNDPTQWRAIADDNKLDDPLDLPPGMILSLPVTTPDYDPCPRHPSRSTASARRFTFRDSRCSSAGNSFSRTSSTTFCRSPTRTTYRESQ